MERSLSRHLDPVAFTTTVPGLQPNPVQARILRAPDTRILLNRTRQWGKSTIIAALTAHYRDLREELLHFRANISGRGYTSDGSSRETVHGGLAIAIALAAWQVRAKATWGGRGGGPVA